MNRNQINNERNLLGLYNILYTDLNSLKERMDKLDNDKKTQVKDDDILYVMKDNNLDQDEIPSTIVTDVYLEGNVLNVVKYDKNTNKIITKSFELVDIKDDSEINSLYDISSKNSTGSQITVENVTDEINKIFKLNPLNH